MKVRNGAPLHRERLSMKLVDSGSVERNSSEKTGKTKMRCTKATPPTRKLVMRLLTKYFDTDKSDNEESVTDMTLNRLSFQ
jgi:hypothetical protein